MNPFRTYVLPWWQVGMTKVALLSMGIAVGTFFDEELSPWFWVFVAVGATLGVSAAILAFGQKKVPPAGE